MPLTLAAHLGTMAASAPVEQVRKGIPLLQACGFLVGCDARRGCCASPATMLRRAVLTLGLVAQTEVAERGLGGPKGIDVPAMQKSHWQLLVEPA